MVQSDITIKFRNFLTAGVIVVVFFALLPLTMSMMPSAYTFFVRHIIEIGAVIAFLFSLKFVYIHRKTNFFHIALAFSAYLLFSVLGEISEAVLGYPLVSVADLFYYTGYIFLIYTCISVLFHYIDYLKKSVLKIVFPLWLIITIFSFVHVVRDVLARNLTSLEKIVLLGYPFLDLIVILLLMLLIVIYQRNALSFFWLMIILGVMSFTIGDFIYALLTSLGMKEISIVTDGLFALEYLLLILGFYMHFKAHIKYAEITPAVEEFVKLKGEPKYRLEPGSTYVIYGKKSSNTYEIFKDYVLYAYQGLCIAREEPEKIRKQYEFKKTPIVWLTDVKTNKESVNSKELEQISYVMTDFIQKSGKKNIIMLDGLEFLINHNSFRAIFNFILTLKDIIAMKKSILVISLNPATIDKSEKCLIEKEFSVI